MKIRKKVIGIFLTAALIIGASMSVLANPVDDIRASLINDGVPASQISNVIEYLQKTTITSAQSAAAIADINQIKALVGSQTDLTKLDAATKASIEADAKNAASELGLSATFSVDANGNAIVSISGANGVLTTMSAASAKSLLNNFSALITSAQAFSVNPDKANFTAVNGSTMKQTATNYGTMMVAGVLLVAAAALSFGFKKKTILA